ncbi:MAG: bifunctional riboflavin kinase/FAD synthetase [Pseudomonadota bacterium]|nr:MAG: bifunctional riboflavin kinase/FAD synthetase [Pseudomonadota bacterium]
MELIRGLHNLNPRHHGCVATIGNFDGVHLGHQAVIGQLAEKADALHLPTLAILFEPQPLEFFQPARAPGRLMRLREKLQALRRYAVDRVLLCRFDARFAALSAEEFIERILVAGLGVRYLVVGDDFRFGAGRRGDFAMLTAAGQRHGFQVVNMHTVNIDGERVSSTRVRTALGAGDLERAEHLLGRPYRMCGRVAHGDKLGRTLGIPTANIKLHRQSSPLHGVFVVEVFGLEREPLPAVASLGTRPTVGGTHMLLEVHLLDFDADIYGRHVNVNFLHKLRDEQRFGSLEELKEWIGRDIAAARQYFAEQHVRRAESVRVPAGERL